MRSSSLAFTAEEDGMLFDSLKGAFVSGRDAYWSAIGSGVGVGAGVGAGAGWAGCAGWGAGCSCLDGFFVPVRLIA